MFVKAALITAVLLCEVRTQTLYHQRATANNETEYDFDKVRPSKDLQWEPCYQKYACAVLEVPLDYNNESSGTTHIAFIRHDAAKQPAQDILYNPGGPGSSGIETVLKSVDSLRQRLGFDYNIVSFDPRGVNNSGPNIDCFNGKAATRQKFESQVFKFVDSTSNDSLRTSFQYADAFGRFCTAAMRNASIPYEFVNTVAVANDMRHFMELQNQKELNYYGVSYGTLLGSTFAMLFPDLVGRFILDGVVDAEDHFKGEWRQKLLQTDTAVASFSTFCHEAGSERCTFGKGLKSSNEILARFNAVLEDITENPIPVYDPISEYFRGPVLVTHDKIRAVIFDALYLPLSSFPELDEIMTLLSKRNGRKLAGLLAGELDFGSPKSDEYTGESDYSSMMTRIITTCADANGRYNISNMAMWEEHVAHLVKQSGYLAGRYAPINALQCRSLGIRPPESQIFGGPKQTVTKNPILFAEELIDPVTPSAHKMSGFFPGSVVFTQMTVGHGLVSGRSNCTRSIIAAYLKDGTLPEAGTKCDVEQKPFENVEPGSMKLKRRTIERLLEEVN